MSIFLCNACNYIFSADDMPDSCPVCHSNTVLGTTDSSRKMPIPAVRAATESEVHAYEKVRESIESGAEFLERVDGLSNYKLSDDEYHVALMLLYFFKSTPANFTAHFISDLLPARDLQIEKRTAQAAAQNLYISAKRHFRSQIGKERRDTGYNDISKVAAELPPDSASGILMKFRQDEFDSMINWPQNLGNVQRVDIEKVALTPGKEYRRFLTEWYNSIL